MTTWMLRPFGEARPDDFEVIDVGATPARLVAIVRGAEDALAIAATPDLLAALERLVESRDGSHSPEADAAAWILARNAVRLAREGE